VERREELPHPVGKRKKNAITSSNWAKKRREEKKKEGGGKKEKKGGGKGTFLVVSVEGRVRKIFPDTQKEGGKKGLRCGLREKKKNKLACF